MPSHSCHNCLEQGSCADITMLPCRKHGFKYWKPMSEEQLNVKRIVDDLKKLQPSDSFYEMGFSRAKLLLKLIQGDIRLERK